MIGRLCVSAREIAEREDKANVVMDGVDSNFAVGHPKNAAHHHGLVDLKAIGFFAHAIVIRKHEMTPQIL